MVTEVTAATEDTAVTEAMVVTAATAVMAAMVVTVMAMATGTDGDLLDEGLSCKCCGWIETSK